MAGENGGPWGGGGGGRPTPPSGGNGGNRGDQNGGQGGGGRDDKPNIPDIDELVRKGQDQLRVLMGGRGNGGGQSGGGGGMGGGGPLVTRSMVGLGLILAFIGWLFASVYTVRPDEQSVELFLGEYSSTGQPGLNFATLAAGHARGDRGDPRTHRRRGRWWSWRSGGTDADRGREYRRYRLPGRVEYHRSGAVPVQPARSADDDLCRVRIRHARDHRPVRAVADPQPGSWGHRLAAAGPDPVDAGQLRRRHERHPRQLRQGRPAVGGDRCLPRSAGRRAAA